MNKTNYKQSTVGNNVNKTRLTILLILIINMNVSPTISNSQVEMVNDSLTCLQSINIDDSDLGLTWLHDQGYNGSSIKIGIIDNGIDFQHAAFTKTNYTEKSFDTPEQQSTQTHGTPVSGVIVGYENINGSAPGATIISAEMGSNSEEIRKRHTVSRSL